MALELLHDAHERERTRGLVAMNAAYGHQHRPRLSMRDPADDASSWEWCGQAIVNMSGIGAHARFELLPEPGNASERDVCKIE